ncbi:phosphatidylserine decarboxylase [Helicobacter monodelphidis]|uniref:phosphatidylserine decarboxylase n=1 Tax=Helicobacter sp. 15-1451 TaxID=2004995 RepID=UPI000DCE397F|nr:phosphatidylserine decarboxylase [Helicobacter sp. 15-1451]RAX56723.1 phosphatidylserine decarboxylase [Helicobacter sp. 15-1451]
MRCLLSNLFGYFANFTFFPCIQNIINKVYISIFKIDMHEFDPPSHYQSLNALFTRSLIHPRPFDKNPNILIAPSDSTIIAKGTTYHNIALQIKGKEYSVAKLLGEKLDTNLQYINFYLSPSDYHRFHAPTDMHILSVRYFSGNLLSVRPSILQKYNVFTENERVVIKALDSFNQELYFVAVGAMNVGKILIYIEKCIHTNAKQGDAIYTYDKPIFIPKGQEIGHFKMGSSIVLFTAANINAELGKISFASSIGFFQE